MSPMPFVLRAMQVSRGADEVGARDVPTSEEPLPAVMEISAQGHLLARDTRLTKVAPETTDDK